MTKANRKLQAEFEEAARQEELTLRESLAAKDRELAEAGLAYQRLCDSLEITGRERDEWKARAEAAEADTRRLDWLEKLGFSTVRNCRGEGPKDDPGVHSWRDGNAWRWTASWINSEYPDVRSAVDAAISAQEPPK